MPKKSYENVIGINEEKDNKKYDDYKKKMDIQKLEKFYVDAEIDNLPKIVEERKKELEDKLENFRSNYLQLKTDKYGNEEYISNPYLVSTYFFKSINPLSSTEPHYSPEKLSVVWDLYMHLVEQVNMNISPFQPSLSHFAKFCGVSLSTLQKYKNCGEEHMMILMEKIFDECFNSNISLAQNGILKEKSTITRMKIENEVVEKNAPNTNINIIQVPDMKQINARLDKYKLYAEKKGK